MSLESMKINETIVDPVIVAGTFRYAEITDLINKITYFGTIGYWFRVTGGDYPFQEVRTNDVNNKLNTAFERCYAQIARTDHIRVKKQQEDTIVSGKK